MLAFAPLLALVALVAAQADPSINTPASVVQCQPAQLTWTASKTPVFLSILPGGQVGATPLQDLGQQTGTSLTWVANIAQGTQITFQIRDSQGVTAFSAPVTVQASSDSSCLGGGASTTGGAATSAASSTPAGSSSAASASSQSSAAVSTSVVSQSTSAAVSTSAATATAPATTSRATSAAGGSTSRAATATSAVALPTPSTNAASSNAKVGLAGLLGLAAAVAVMA